MSILQKHIGLLQTAAIANNWTSDQVARATDVQIKNVLGLTMEQAQKLQPWATKLKSIVSKKIVERENIAMWQSIIAALTPAQRQWIKAQDSIWLAEQINPPPEEVIS